MGVYINVLLIYIWYKLFLGVFKIMRVVCEKFDYIFGLISKKVNLDLI